MTADPIFGDGYTAEQIDLGSDDEGPIIATLVHRLQAPGDAPRTPHAPPVLVGHGWSDYVFDRDLLDHIGSRGFDVWALDLRKHGRSLLAGQTPTAVDHLNRYDEEIDAALRIIGRDRPPVLLAHSTGGLIALLYAMRHPRAVRALALNSPWLEMHLGPVARRLLAPPVKVIAQKLRTRPILPPGSTHFAQTTHLDFGGLYDYDLDLKPPRGHRFPASTLAAVLDGQERLAAAGPLHMPILVMHSARTRIGILFTEEMRRSDSVLDIRTMVEAAKRLGPNVRIEEIDGARHDVFMSDADARAHAIGVLDDWLDGLTGSPSTMRTPEHRRDLAAWSQRGRAGAVRADRSGSAAGEETRDDGSSGTASASDLDASSG